MQKEKTKSEKRWESIVKKLPEIPDNRKNATPENLRWFLRNGSVLMHKNASASDAVYFAQRALDGL